MHTDLEFSMPNLHCELKKHDMVYAVAELSIFVDNIKLYVDPAYLIQL